MNHRQHYPILANQLQMDRSSPLPPKRPRRTEQLHVKDVSSINPSSTSSKMESNIHKQLMKLDTDLFQFRASTNIKPNIQSLSTLKFVPNKAINISSKMQTLKLKSPDGRDLGEINVKLLPQKGNKISGKTIMLKKHSMFGRLDTSSAISILKPSKTQNLTFADVQLPTRSSVDAAIASRLISSTTDHQMKSSSFKTNSVGSTTNNPSPTSTSIKIKEIEETSDDRKKILSMMVVNDSFRSSPSMRKIIISGERTTTCQAEMSRCETVSKQKVVLARGNNQSASKSIEDIDDNVEDQPRLSMRKKFVLLSTDEYKQLKQKCSAKNPKLVHSQQILLTDQAADSTDVIPVRSSDAILPRISSITNPENDATKNSSPISMDTDPIEQRTVNSTHRTHVTKRNITSANIVAQNNAIKPIARYESENENDATSSSNDNDTESSLSHNETSFMESLHDFQSEKSNLQPVPVKTSTSEQRKVLEVTDKLNTDKNSEQANQHHDGKLIKTKATRLDNNVANTSNNDQSLHLGKNIMVKIHREMGLLNDNSQISCNERWPSNHARVDTNKKSDTIAPSANTIQRNLSHSNPNTNNSHDNIRSKQMNDSICHSKTAIEQDIDNLQKTLSTLTDENLREKVLKALADCGIGLQREVPVQKSVSVKDSPTQTTIFSLLDSGNLLEFNNDNQTLSRLPVMSVSNHPNQSIMNKQIINCNMDSVHQPYPQQEDNSLFTLDPNLMFCDFSLEDSFPDDLLNSIEVHKVKNILTERSPMITRTIEQLKRDFEAANIVDDNGFFGIHRAVLSGNIKEIRRQLSILKGLKRNVDNVLTEDGRTSLELAVMQNVDAPIIKLLLSVGAKPASTDKLHESALIIACRKSSSVLPELISHVTPTSLLDIAYAEGFAPLHYCAQLGNMIGVESLVAAGADVNLRDLRSGRTALFHALDGKYITIAAYLLNNGAKSNIPNFAGQSPTTLVDEYKMNNLSGSLMMANNTRETSVCSIGNFNGRREKNIRHC